MRPFVLAASAVAVFLLVMVTFASLGGASPPSGDDRCKTCHPVPHAEGFAVRGHGDQIRTAPLARQACSSCHLQSFCSTCHG